MESRRLTSEQMASVERLMDLLMLDTDATCALLIDFSGQIITTHGGPDDFNPSILGVLMAGGMATSLEIARALNEDQITSLHFHKGLNHEVYGCMVDDQTLICLILDQDSDTTQVGMVWLILKKTIEELRVFLSEKAEDDLPNALRFDSGLKGVLEEVWVENEDESVRGRDDIFTETEVQFVNAGEESDLISFNSAVELGLVDQD